MKTKSKLRKLWDAVRPVVQSLYPAPAEARAIFESLEERRLLSTAEIFTNGRDNDVVYDGEGNLHLAYYDSSTEARHLMYATRPAGGQWTVPTIIDETTSDVGRYPSIAIDANGKPGISYYDVQYSDLRYAAFDGSSWNISIVDETGDVGKFTSLAYNANNKPAISYFDNSKNDLKIAFINAAGTWTRQTIDSIGDVGRHTSLAIKPGGHWAISYADNTNTKLKYAEKQPDQSVTFQIVDTVPSAAKYSSLAFYTYPSDAPENPNPSYPAISYQSVGASSSSLKLAIYNGSTWSKQVVPAPTTQGQYTNLFFDYAHDDVVIAYHDAALDKAMVAQRSLAPSVQNDVTSPPTTANQWRSHVMVEGGGEQMSAVKTAMTEGGLVTYTYLLSANAHLYVDDYQLPLPSISGPTSTSEGTGETFTFAAIDPAFTGTITWDIEWGDGTSSTLIGANPPAIVHAWADSRQEAYQVTATAWDNNGTSHSVKMYVTVGNVDPTATLSNSGPVGEGKSVTVSLTSPFDLSKTDMNAGLRYSFALSEGGLANSYASAAKTNSASFVFPDNPSSPPIVWARIFDKDGGSSTYQNTVTVNNIAPIAAIINNGPVMVNSPVVVSLINATDSSGDVAAQLRYSFATSTGALASSYGVPNASTNSSATFSFGNPGTRTIYARVIDKDGGYTTYSTSVVINTAELNLVPLTGTPFGSTPNAAVGTEADKAFDGGASTYYQGPGNGAHVGIDLGEGYKAAVAVIRFSPRNGGSYPATINGGRFQGSVDGLDYFDLHPDPISGTSLGWNEIIVNDAITKYRYLRFVSDSTQTAYIADIQFLTVVPNNAPAAPANLVAQAVSESEVNLSWSTNGQNDFTIERKLEPSGIWKEIGTVTTGSFTDSEVQTARQYSYRVRVNNESEKWVYSRKASATTLGYQMKLTGSAFGGGTSAAGNEFYRAFDGSTTSYYAITSTDNGIYTGIDLGEGNSKAISMIRFHPRTSFESEMLGGTFEGSNTGLPNDFANLYTITPTPERGWNQVYIDNAPQYRYLRYVPGSGAGNVAEVEFYAKVSATAPAAPTGLTVTAASTEAIELAWSQPSPTSTSFSIERKNDLYGAWEEVGVSSTTEHIDGDISAGQRYYYRVRAVDSASSWLYSGEVIAKVPGVTVLFEQNFDAGTWPSAFESASPTFNQFNDVNWFGTNANSGNIQFLDEDPGEGLDGAVRYDRINGPVGFWRTTDLGDGFSTDPASAWKFSFQITPNNGPASPGNRAALWVGNGFQTGTLSPSGSTRFAMLTFNSTDTAGEYTISYTGGGTQTSDAFNNTQQITWILNNSGSTLSYVAPDGSTQMIDNDQIALYIGDAHQFNAPAQGPNVPLQEFFGTVTSSNASLTFDNFRIETDLDTDPRLLPPQPPMVPIVAPPAVLFEQNFDAGPTIPLEAYESPTPNTGQFDDVNNLGGAGLLAIQLIDEDPGSGFDGAVRYNRTTGKPSFWRITDLGNGISSNPASSWRFSFDVTPNSSPSTAGTRGVMYAGNGFNIPNTGPSGTTRFAALNFNSTATAGQMNISYAVGGATPDTTSNFSTTQRVTWILNNSGGAITYLAPDGETEETLGNDMIALYLGNQLQFTALAQGPNVPLQEFFGAVTSTASLTFDNFKIEGGLDSNAPHRVTGLSSEWIDAQIMLSWSAQSNTDSYNIYRGTAPGGQGATPYVTGHTGTAFQDTNLAPGLTYYYTITAVNDEGESVRSAERAVAPMVSTSGTPVINSVTIFLEQDEGNLYSISGTFSDPNPESLTATIVWAEAGEPTAAEVNAASGTFSASHAYLQDGSYYGLIALRPNEPTRVEYPFLIEVTNLPPVFSQVTFDPAIQLGGTLNISAILTDPGILDEHILAIDWGDESTPDEITEITYVNGQATINASYAGYPAVGTYTVTLTATDNADSDSIRSFAFQVVVGGATNYPPTADAGGDVEVDEGQEVILIGVGTDPDPGDVLVYRWEIRDIENNLVSEADEQEISFVPPDNGVYTATFIVNDGVNPPVSDTATITVANANPTAVFELIEPAIEGIPAVFQFVDVSDSFADIEAGLLFSFDWDDDGVWDILDAEFPVVEHSFPDQGTYVVRGRVADKDGGESVYEINVDVANADPQFYLSYSEEVPQGDLAWISGVIHDPGLNDTHTVQVEWVSGILETVAIFDSYGESAFEASHAYGVEGVQQVRVIVTDSDGGSNEYPFTVLVGPPAPTEAPAGFEATWVDGELHLSWEEVEGVIYRVYRSTTPGQLGTEIWSGSNASGFVDPTPPAGGEFVLYSLTAEIMGRGASAAEAIAMISDGAAALDPIFFFDSSAGDEQGKDEGEQVTFDFSYDLSGPTPGPGFRYSYDFDGDGTWDFIDSPSPQAAYIYPDDGVYIARGLITDEDGYWNVYSTVVTINNVQPTLQISGDPTGVVGEWYEISLSAFDPGDDQILYWTIEWEDSVFSYAGDATTVRHKYANPGIYHIAAFATDEDGTTDYYSDTNIVRVEVAAPDLFLAAPSGLTATAMGGNQIVLTWEDESIGEIQFDVEWRYGAFGIWTSWLHVDSLPWGSTNYTHEPEEDPWADPEWLWAADYHFFPLDEHVEYEYRVIAWGPSGESSEYSNVASPQAIQALTSDDFYYSATTTWTDRYGVTVSTDPDPFQLHTGPGSLTVTFENIPGHDIGYTWVSLAVSNISSPSDVQFKIYLDSVLASQAGSAVFYNGFDGVFIIDLDEHIAPTMELKIEVTGTDNSVTWRLIDIEFHLRSSQRLRIDGGAVFEGSEDSVGFTIHRTDGYLASVEDLDVYIELDEERTTAVQGVDFAPLPNMVTIPAGSPSAFVPLVLLGDNSVPDWTKEVALKINLDGFRYPLFYGTASMFIVDEDPIKLSIAGQDPAPASGVVIPVNDDDDNEDGIPDWLNPVEIDGSDLVRLETLIPTGVEPGSIVRLEVDFNSYLRIWTSPLKGEGNLLVDETWYNTGFEMEWHVTEEQVPEFWLESLPGFGSATITLTVETPYAPTRIATLVVSSPEPDVNIAVDLDIDSDNTLSPSAAWAFLGTDEEEQIEDMAGRPGKFILVNDGDVNGNMIPDFADIGVGGAIGKNFVPLSVSLPLDMIREELRVSFSYPDSNPLELSPVGTGIHGAFTPEAGSLRIWTNWETPVRDGQAVKAGGHFVAAQTAQGEAVQYTLAELGLVEGQNVVKLWVEAVRPSASLGDLRIVATITDGNEVAVDAVRLTALASNDADAFSGAVRLSDLTVTLGAVDLASGGFVGPFGVMRTFTEQLGFAVENVAGNGMMLWPKLIQGTGSMIAIVGGVAEYFDLVGFGQDNKPIYQARFSSRSRLTVHAGGYALTDGDGNTIGFNGFNEALPILQRGQFAGYSTAGGASFAVTQYDEDGNIREISHGGFEQGRMFTLAYYSDGPAKGLLSDATLRQWDDEDWQVIESAHYRYYGMDDMPDFGRTGDLASVTALLGDGTRRDTTYYRYDSFSKRLKMVIGPEGSALARGAGKDPASEAVSDTDLLPFADYVFSYSGGKVATQAIQGAGGSSSANRSAVGTYSYAPAGYQDRSGMNAWKYAVTITHPDTRLTEQVYMNYAGQMMLSSLEAALLPVPPGAILQWNTFYEHDEFGRVTMIANPSAIPQDAVVSGDRTLLGGTEQGKYARIWDDEGLVDLFDYYPMNQGGLVQYQWIQNGDSTQPILQRTLTYEADASETVYVVKTDTVYTDENEFLEEPTGGITTTYNYGWSGKHIGSRTTVRLNLAGELNAATVNRTSSETYDSFGRLTAWRDADGPGDGFVHSIAYDPATGAVIATSDQVAAGVFITTSTIPDEYGRPKKYTDGRGNTTTFVNEYDATKEHDVTWIYAPESPAQVIRVDRKRGYVQMETREKTGSSLFSLSRQFNDHAGRPVFEDRYFVVSGSFPDAQIGQRDEARSYRTLYEYDNAGRMRQVTNGAGTIRKSVFDPLGRPIESWIGTGATLTKYEEMQYDDGGVGDGTLTKVTQLPGGGEANRVTASVYDWRNRPLVIQEAAPVPGPNDTTIHTRAPITDLFYNNLDQVTARHIYDGFGHDLTSFEFAVDKLVRVEQYDYDDRGQLKASVQFDVNEWVATWDFLSTEFPELPQDEFNDYMNSVTSLLTQFGYDGRGNVHKQVAPGGLVSTMLYDGMGRVYEQSVGKGTDVLQSVQMKFDANGNPTLITATQNGPGGPRISYVGNWYDESDRLTASVDFGTNGGAPPAVDDNGLPLLPPRGDIEGNPFDGNDPFLRVDYNYYADGRLQFVTDAREVKSRYAWDALGRKVEQIEAYTGGLLTRDSNYKTRYEYTPLDEPRVVTEWVFGDKRVTEYLYQDGTSADLLTKILHPGHSAADAGSKSAFQETFSYNLLGEVTLHNQRAHISHVYTRDALGRITSDALGSSAPANKIDEKVTKRTYAYDALGRGVLFSGLSGAGAIVNQVKREYDGFGNISKEYQEHNGAVITASSKAVEYQYETVNGGSRLAWMKYPDGRYVWYGYDGFGRVASISDGTSTAATTEIERYDYLGVATPVGKHRRIGANVELNLTMGFDAFGRTESYLWQLDSGPAGLSTRQSFEYGYDAVGNMLYSLDLLNNSGSNPSSELHHADGAHANDAYDDLGRRKGFQLGALNSEEEGDRLNTIAGQTITESWLMSSKGNFIRATPPTPAARPIFQGLAREVNPFSRPGSIWRPEALSVKYDAWGNLTELQKWQFIGMITSHYSYSSFQYDALGRRIHDSDWAGGDLYYDLWGNVIQQGKTAVVAQYVWSPADGQLILRDRNRDGNAGTTGYGVSASGLEERLYALDDGRGNVSAIADAAGAVVERYLYTPEGAMATVDANFQPLAATPSPYAWGFTFQGGWRNRDGIYYLPGRGEWDYLTGGILHADPAAYVHARNEYSEWTIRNSPYDSGRPDDGWSYMPVYGPGRLAVHNFGRGDWGQGLANSVVALTDFVLVGAIARTGFRVAGMGAAKAGVEVGMGGSFSGRFAANAASSFGPGARFVAGAGSEVYGISAQAVFGTRLAQGYLAAARLGRTLPMWERVTANIAESQAARAASRFGAAATETVSSQFQTLRATARFLKSEGLNSSLRRSMIEAGFTGIIGAETPATLTRFRRLFSETMRAGKAFKGKLGNISTRVATVMEARAIESAGLLPKFEHWTGRHAIDLVALNAARQPVGPAVQFVKWNRLWRDEIPKAFQITHDTGLPVRFVVTR